MADIVTTKPITAEDVTMREAQEQAAREIVHGEWSEENEMASFDHGAIGARLLTFLNLFVMQYKLGAVCQDNMTYVLEGTPDNIICMRIPDLSFIKAERAKELKGRKGHLYLAPDLAVEIVSSTEAPEDTAAKVADYLKHGTQQVWVVYPDQQQVIVHLPDGSTANYGASDQLVGGDLLPDFALAVSQLFEE